MADNYSDCKLYLSDKITDTEYVGKSDISTLLHGREYLCISDLHLGVSLRSFRSEKLALFVKLLLDERADDAKRQTKAFIQIIHKFRDEALTTSKPPLEKVVIFDEAQRAWNKDKLSDFMKRKKGIPDFNQSEPEFLISIMDRHRDWAVIVCLVGGGQ